MSVAVVVGGTNRRLKHSRVVGMLAGLPVGDTFGAMAGGRGPLQVQPRVENSSDAGVGSEWSLRMDENQLTCFMTCIFSGLDS